MQQRQDDKDRASQLPPLLLDYDEAARLLAVSRRTIEALAAAGVIRKVAVGTPASRKPAVRFVYADLLAWIDRTATKGGRR